LSFLAGVSYEEAVGTHVRAGVRRRLIFSAAAFVADS